MNLSLNLFLDDSETWSNFCMEWEQCLMVDVWNHSKRPCYKTAPSTVAFKRIEFNPNYSVKLQPTAPSVRTYENIS